MHPDILVVIVTYKSERYILKCLSDVLKQDLPCDIMIIDNNSKDNLSKIVTQLNHSNISLVLNDTNYGYASAVNQGLQRALEIGYKYVFVANPDIEIDNAQTLSTLVGSFDNDPNIGAVGPHVIQVSWGEYNNSDNRSIEEVSWISGCGIMLTRDSIEKVGFFDEDYFVYFEESDYLRRLSRNGIKIVKNNSAIIKHLGGASTNGMPTKCYYYMIRNIFLFSKKNVLKFNISKGVSEIVWQLRNKFYFPMHPFRLLAFVLGVLSGLVILFIPNYKIFTRQNDNSY